MNPECFVNFTPLRQTPCSRCPVRGKCAIATDFGGFLVMPTPRYPRNTARIEARPTTAGDFLAKHVLKLMGDRGYDVTATAVKIGTKTVVRVRDTLTYALILEFPDISSRRMFDMRATVRGNISPMLMARKNKSSVHTTIPSIERIRQEREVGCRVVCSDPADAVDIIVEVARRIYGGEG